MKRRLLGRRVANILTGILIAIAAICASMLVKYAIIQANGTRAEQRMQMLYDSALAEEIPIIGEVGAFSPSDDFLPLLESNPETVGWLKVGDIINMAVVQRDNSFYLDHNFFGESAVEGTVFMDEGCRILPRDAHLILHGHNMRNGTVFGELDRYRNLDYLKKNPIITFNSLYQEDQYVVIAAFDMSAEPDDPQYMDLQIFNFNDEAFDAFVADARNRSLFTIPIDVQAGDALLSLATCSYSQNNGRFILMCRALRPDETSEEVATAMQACAKK